MATPDISQWESSAEIFSGTHTLPQIRAINTLLKNSIDEKASRLRTQVGGSYRELLGTADAIVRMRQDNKDVQHLLAAMGSQCGRAIVTDKADNFKKFAGQQEKTQASTAARTRLLDNCTLSVDRVLRGSTGIADGATVGDCLILAAKLLILGRLLVGSLQEDAQTTREKKTVDGAKKTLESLRWRLRRGIDKVLEKPSEDEDRDNILKALCARSIASSSGAKDALRYLLDVRGKSLKAAFEHEDSERAKTQESAIHALKLYVRTILDVQALLPNTLPLALSKLKQTRLLADPTLKNLDCLRLDLYEKWCSEEIRFHTPFVRHDDLDGKMAKDALSKWAEGGSQEFIAGLKATAEAVTDFKSMVELRSTILELWVRNGAKAKGFDPQDMQDDIRETINGRLLSMLESKALKLRLVGSEISATLESWIAGTTDKQSHLWDNNGYEESLDQGAAPFLQDVISRLYGRNNAVSKAFRSYLAWFNSVDEVRSVAADLRKERWDNDYDEVEDEDTIAARQQVLSKDDPALLEKKLDSALDQAYKSLEAQLQELWQLHSTEKSAESIATYLVRVIRDLRTKLPERSAVSTFGVGIVPLLHKRIVTDVISVGTKDFVSTGLKNRTVECRPLWDGEPALPNQPSPDVFNMLHQTSLKMSELGVDLWTPAAKKVLKERLASTLTAAWNEELSALAEDKGSNQTDTTEPVESEDDEEGEDRIEKSQKEPTEAANTELPANVADICTQWLFDVALLQHTLGAEDTFRPLADAVYKQSALADDAHRKRIIKSASAYCQRISMLFGLFE